MARLRSALACAHLAWCFSAAASVTGEDDVSVDGDGECAVLRRVCVSNGALHMRTAAAADAARAVLRAVSDTPYYGEQSIPAYKDATDGTGDCSGERGGRGAPARGLSSGYPI